MLFLLCFLFSNKLFNSLAALNKKDKEHKDTEVLRTRWSNLSFSVAWNNKLYSLWRDWQPKFSFFHSTNSLVFFINYGNIWIATKLFRKIMKISPQIISPACSLVWFASIHSKERAYKKALHCNFWVLEFMFEHY